MRISDWSSTCALPISAAGGTAKLRQLVPVPPHPQQDGQGRRLGSVWTLGCELSRRFRHHLERGRQRQHGGRYAGVPHPCRSEEHTSELQSLMRISYAVFCLKKKTEAHTI